MCLVIFWNTKTFFSEEDFWHFLISYWSGGFLRFCYFIRVILGCCTFTSYYCLLPVLLLLPPFLRWCVFIFFLTFWRIRSFSSCSDGNGVVLVRFALWLCWFVSSFLLIWPTWPARWVHVSGAVAPGFWNKTNF